MPPDLRQTPRVPVSELAPKWASELHDTSPGHFRVPCEVDEPKEYSSSALKNLGEAKARARLTEWSTLYSQDKSLPAKHHMENTQAIIDSINSLFSGYQWPDHITAKNPGPFVSSLDLFFYALGYEFVNRGPTKFKDLCRTILGPVYAKVHQYRHKNENDTGNVPKIASDVSLHATSDQTAANSTSLPVTAVSKTMQRASRKQFVNDARAADGLGMHTDPTTVSNPPSSSGLQANSKKKRNIHKPQRKERESDAGLHGSMLQDGAGQQLRQDNYGDSAPSASGEARASKALQTDGHPENQGRYISPDVPPSSSSAPRLDPALNLKGKPNAHDTPERCASPVNPQNGAIARLDPISSILTAASALTSFVSNKNSSGTHRDKKEREKVNSGAKSMQPDSSNSLEDVRSGGTSSTSRDVLGRSALFTATGAVPSAMSQTSARLGLNKTNNGEIAYAKTPAERAKDRRAAIEGRSRPSSLPQAPAHPPSSSTAAVAGTTSLPVQKKLKPATSTTSAVTSSIPGKAVDKQKLTAKTSSSLSSERILSAAGGSSSTAPRLPRPPVIATKEDCPPPGTKKTVTSSSSTRKDSSGSTTSTDLSLATRDRRPAAYVAEREHQLQSCIAERKARTQLNAAAIAGARASGSGDAGGSIYNSTSTARARGGVANGLNSRSAAQSPRKRPRESD